MVERCDVPFERGPRLCATCRLKTGVPGLRRCSRMVAESAAMQALLKRITPMAAADAPMVLQGETGSGKEVLARAVHANSARSRGPFVAVNVAALPAELLESELFGHEKGAFTGATATRRGLMAEAHGGTLFLDEIGEMPLSLQVKLLRALQDGEVRAVGATRTTSVDIRVLCATHRDLWDQVQRGLFREDLYYRLRVFSVTIPPLRERREDIGPLARLFVEQEGLPEAFITPAALRALQACPWPGNVRELANAVKHAVALAGGGEILPAHLPEDVLHARPRTARSGDMRPLADVEREHVLRVLEACAGNQVEAARMLGIGRTTLWRKLGGWGVVAP